MHDDTPSAVSKAASALSDAFLELMSDRSHEGFASIERAAWTLGNQAMALGLARALEALDRRLCESLPSGTRVHDVRSRTLLTEAGDVKVRLTRARDAYGNTVVPVAEALDLPWGCRISPGAEEFLVEAGSTVSYERAARLMARNGGSRVSASAAMSALRRAGAACRAEDEAAAAALLDDGVAPCGARRAEVLCVEADGTWVPLQGGAPGGPARIEVKAAVAYAGRGLGGGRRHPVSFGCVGSPDRFWGQALASMGSSYDLGAVRECHLGADGEGWCKAGAFWLPGRVTSHLDPFHLNRAIASATPSRELASCLMAMAADGDAQEAACALEAAAALGLARPEAAARVAGYLRRNAEAIGADGPALGTMEAEVQHTYASRLEAWPCAWSADGADAMARIRSRQASGRPLPRRTRASSITAKRARRSEERTLMALRGPAASEVLESVGSGYEPPHQATTSAMPPGVRHAARGGTRWRR